MKLRQFLKTWNSLFGAKGIIRFPFRRRPVSRPNATDAFRSDFEMVDENLYGRNKLPPHTINHHHHVDHIHYF